VLHYTQIYFFRQKSIMFVDVVIDSPILESAETLVYKVPKILENSMSVGLVVLVPLGKYQKRGIVINIKKQVKKSPFVIKDIKKIVFADPVITDKQILIAKRMSKYYFTALYKCIKLFVPRIIWSSDHEAKKESYYTVNKDSLAEFSKRAIKQQNLFLDIIRLKGGEVSIDEIKTLPSYSSSALKALVDKDILIQSKKEVLRNPLADYKIEKKELPTLSKIQKKIFKDIIKSKNSYHLIRGVTGSGKTEVYIHIVNSLLKKGKSVIILIPEINLTPQSISRFLQYFPDQIAVWHSHLSEGERFDEWRRIKSGKAKVVIGSRSALFTPVYDLGAILIDEEHDRSYKQDSSPRYHARKVASFMASGSKVKLVLGSATPSIETYYYAKKDVIELHEIEERFFDVSLPDVKIVDLTVESRHMPSPIGHKLYLAISQTLEAGEQVILLLNKRGAYSSFQCFDCGKALECSKCDIPFTVHKNSYNNQFNLMCHYCGSVESVPSKCPGCGGALMRGVGYGTQSIEEELKKSFQDANIVRVDTDSVSKKGSHKKIYDKFLSKEIDILIGTQMIAKGLDIPNVSLVGVILADIGLHMPDFRAQEKIFQLMTQVAGRAGRRKKGSVIIQTYSSDNTAIVHAKKHDYIGFYEKEIIGREAFKYPPYSYLLKLEYADISLERCKDKSLELVDILRQEFDGQQINILGPSPALFPKIYNKYHYQILIKASVQSIWVNIIKIVPAGWRIDIDPQ